MVNSIKESTSIYRVLVIGGSGNVGRLILPFLAKEFSVTVFDLKAPPRGKWKYFYGDIKDQKALKRASKGMDALLYMARGSFNPINHITTSYDVNVKGLHLALEAARQAGVKRVVYTSTVSVYDGYGDLSTGATDNEQVPPLVKTAYALTKQMGEQVCQFFHDRHKLPVLVLRLFAPVSDEERRTKLFKGSVDCRTEASDLARAIISSLRSTHSEFEVIHITGDQSGRAYHHEKAKRILGWEPYSQAFQCETVRKNDDHWHAAAEFSFRARFPNKYENLFQAALLKGEPAMKAWDGYCASHSTIEIEKDFENEPYLLLPLLYRNLEDHGRSASATLPTKYAGVYRYTWTRNQNLLRDAAQIIELFLNVGIETLILKGAALSITHYQNLGLRPMQDVDVVIKPEKLRSAIRILKQSGWTLRRSSPSSEEFENSAGNRFDVHWFIGENEWKRAKSVVIQDVSAWTLNVTDHLDFICDIYKWNVLSIADSFMLINNSSYSIDWDRLIENKKNPGQILALHTMLHYLSVVLKAHVPEPILNDLTHYKIDRRTYFCFIAVVCPPKINAENPFVRFSQLWSCYWRSVPSKNFLSSLIGFPLYLRYRWNTNRWWKLPFVAFKRLTARPKLRNSSFISSQ